MIPNLRTTVFSPLCSVLVMNWDITSVYQITGAVMSARPPADPFVIEYFQCCYSHLTKVWVVEEQHHFVGVSPTWKA